MSNIGPEKPRRENEVTTTAEGGGSKMVATSYVLGDTVHLEVSGESNLYTASELKRVLNRQLDGFPNLTKVEADFRVSFIDSSTLGVLITAFKKLQRVGHKFRNEGRREASFRVAVDDRNIHKLFEITGLDKVFEVRLVEKEEK